ncbi:MAG: cysteine synthase family protein [Candidatus Magasanikbacteria bacterium]|nr:cysteine synthase family protein [Candidatus Magasanikbacteria bacterium]
MIYENILKTIGNTPMVKINRINTKLGVDIFVKLEGVNPGGSIKDRVALKMIEQAEKEGTLTKNKIIIEATSGNTGIALSMIAAVKGYSATMVMSKAVSAERRKMIEAFGAQVVLTDPKKGTDGAILKVREMIKKDPEKYFHTDQFSNMNNRNAHYETTAREIWKQSGGRIDYFVSALGTSGTLMGVAKYLKEKNPNIKIVSAEPVEGHYIQGLKNMKEALVPEIYDKKLLDKIIMIESEEAFAMARRVVREEGISVGMSSGAAMVACLKIAKKIKTGNIVTIFPDRGEKYLSTKLFE